MAEVPAESRFVIVGGGVHGISTAWHLAQALRESGEEGSVVLLERDRLGSGASGISGGIVRNYYRSEAMTGVIAESVGIFESDPEGFGFHQVGYLAVVPERQREDLEAIAARQAQVGYDSELVVGNDACREYLEWLWPDVNSGGVAAALMEKRSGWADAAGTVRNLARKAREAGAQLFEGVDVTGISYDGGRACGVQTTAGEVACEAVIGAPGVWTPEWWQMQGLEPVVRHGGEEVPISEYWLAREGDFVLPGVGLSGSAGRSAPVVHYDMDEPLVSQRDGSVITDEPWGVYFRLGRTGEGIVGGALPLEMGDGFSIDPYGQENPEQMSGDDLSDFFVSGLAHFLKRFRGHAGEWEERPAGGVLALSPDRYPITDWSTPGVYSIVDAGHGFKMLAIGREVAGEVLGGVPSELLEPFRLSRFAEAATHVESRSPYPWT